MAGRGNDEKQPLEWVYIVFMLFAGISAWLIWTYGRKWIVLPAFGSNWLMIQAVEIAKRGLGVTGLAVEDHIASFFDGRRNASRDIDWGTFVSIREIVGAQVKVFVSGIICALAVLIVFKMKGDRYKRRFSLAGGKGQGPSLAIEQAKLWKTATMGALFDPDGRDKEILPARTPFEWLKLNDISYEDSQLDREGCENAFAKQLGKPWHGVKRAELPVQVLLLLAGMHLTRNKAAISSRENMSMSWAAGADGTAAMKAFVESSLANEKLVSVIDKVCAKNAYASSAAITMIDFARRKSGVLASSDFIWMRRVDRNLWYALNNVGRRRFHCEGAGAIAHYFAERAAGNALPEPYVEEAVNGLEDYLDEQGIESLELFFERQNKEEF